MALLNGLIIAIVLFPVWTFAEVELSPIQFVNCLITQQKNPLKSELLEAEGDLSLAEHAFYPTVEVGFNTGKDVLSNSGTTTGTSSTGTVMNMGSELVGEATVSIQQNLIDVSKSKFIDARAVSVKSNQYYFLNKLFLNISAQIDSFYDLLLSQAEVRVLKEKSDLLSKLVALQTEVTKVKLADGSDLLAAKADLINVSIQIQTRESDIKNNMSVLKSKVGLEEDLNLKLDSETISFTSAKEDWNSKISDFSYLKYLRFKAQAFAQEKSSIDSKLIPNLSWQLSLNQHAYGYQGTGMPAQSANIYAFITMPLYDGSIRSIEASKVSAQKMVVEEELRLQKNDLAVGIENLLNKAKLLESQKKQSEERVQLTSRARSAAWTQFRLGRMPYFNFSEFQNSYIEATLADRQLSLDKSKVSLLLYMYEMFSEDYSSFWKNRASFQCK